MSVSELSVRGLQSAWRLRSLVVFGGGFALAAVAGLAVGALGGVGLVAVLSLLVWMSLPLVFYRFPATAVLIPASIALIAEQAPSTVADHLTERLQLFRTLNTSAGLSGVVVSPFEIVVVTAALTLLIRRVATRETRIPGSALSRGLAILVLILGLAMLRGRNLGGDFRIMTDEVRPFLYVAVLYLMASRAIRTQGQAWALLWVEVVVTGLKGVQGTYRYIALLDALPKPDAILGHDEAMFFSLYILLTAGLWIVGMRTRLRLVATVFLPFVVTADLANQRRAAWVILGMGAALLLVSCWLAAPQRRRRTLAVAIVASVLTAAYLPAFWNSTGTLAEPARALKSAYEPSDRDDNSDFYRRVERIDLGIDIRLSGPLGYGFGRPIAHPIPLPYDASTSDPLIDYIPHNSILYLWLRSGVAGALAFWFVIGAATVVACRVIPSANRRLSLVGSFALWTVAAYVFEGWLDQGLSAYRVGVFAGCVLGCVDAAHRINRAEVPSQLVPS